jgi:glycosyltransferase involved in cell wall biosynthesis
MTTRNSEKVVDKTLSSLLKQTIKPVKVYIIDDGSSDGTLKILKDFSSKTEKVTIITKPDMGYDSRRIVHNWNDAIRMAKNDGIETDYHFITADDCIYPQNYCEFLIKRMEEDKSLVVCSGDCSGTIRKHTRLLSAPRGSGRMIGKGFFKRLAVNILHIMVMKVGFFLRH